MDYLKLQYRNATMEKEKVFPLFVEIFLFLVYNVKNIFMNGDKNMATENNKKDKTILVHSKQGTNNGTIKLQDLIKQKQDQNKNRQKSKGDDES